MSSVPTTNKAYPGGDVLAWHQYQDTGTNDCGAYCAAMVANAVLGWRRFDGASVAREMERVSWAMRPFPHPVLRKVPGWISLPWGIASFLCSQGLHARWGFLGNLKRLRRNLREGRFTIVIVGEPLRREGLRYAGWAHAKVFYGFGLLGGGDVSRDWDTQGGILFVDPGAETSVAPGLSAGLCWQHVDQFLREWKNFLRLYVEVDRETRL